MRPQAEQGLAPGAAAAALDCLQEYSHLRGAVWQVSEAISEVRRFLQQADDGICVEIEGRLGVRDQAGFRPDVGASTFETLLGLLNSYPGWLEVTPWQETHDVFYHIDVPVGAGGKPVRTQVRSSVAFDADRKLALQHIVKRKLRTVDLRVTSLDTAEAGGSSLFAERLAGPSHVRVGVALEQRVPEELLPVAVTPTLVRIKQRKRFLLQSLGLQRPAFAVELSVVYSGDSKSQAEQRQAAAQEASHEVEVECLEPLAYLCSCSQQESMLALSLLLKLHDFCAALNPQAAVSFARVGG